MPILLEPISIHTIPFSFHGIDDGVELPFASHVCSIRVQILFEVVAIEMEDGLFVVPEMVH